MVIIFRYQGPKGAPGMPEVRVALHPYMRVNIAELTRFGPLH